MKIKWLAVFAFTALTGCATPQYTVLGAAPNGTQTSGGVQDWPEMASWEPVEGAQKDVAIIVAIEDYAFLPDVPGAIQNANDWENYFRKARGMKEVYTLTDKAATSEEIQRFVDQAVATADADASLWFVFIGHGAALTDGSDGAIIGMDAQQTITSIQARSLPRKSLIASLEAGKQARTLVVLDACFSGRDPEGKLLAEGTQPVVPISKPMTTTKGTLVFSAAAGDEVAGQLPGSTRPAFSYLLLGGLRGWAAEPGKDISAGDMDAWLKQQFRQIRGRQQTPAVEGNPDLVLARAGEADPGVGRMMRGDVTKTVTTNTNTTGSTRIDTGHLEFTQPTDWAIGPVGMGIILYMTYMYGTGEISVTRMEMSASQGAAWIQGAASEEYGASGIGHVKIAGPEKVVWGKTTGVISAYEDPDPNFAAHYLHFDTYQAGAVYRFTLQSGTAGGIEEAAPVFQELVTTSEFK